MKKYLLLFFAVMLSIGMWAAGTGDGSNKSNAIEFDWNSKGNVVMPTGSDSLWFRVDLMPLYDEDVESPTLALYLTNLTTETATVTMSASLAGQDEVRTYTIGGQKNMLWSKNASILIKMKQTEAYVALRSDKQIALSAKVYETAYTDESCKDAKNFVWSGMTQPETAVGQWYKVDLSAASLPENAGKEIEIKIANIGNANAHITGQISTDCPCSGTTDYNSTLAPGSVNTKRINRAMIDMLETNELYIRVIADQTLKISASWEDKETPGKTVDCSADSLKLNTKYNVSAGTQTVYKIYVDSIRQKRRLPELTLTNLGTATANITGEIAFSCGTDVDVMERTATLGAGKTLVKEVEQNMIEGIKDGIKFVYVIINSDQPLEFSVRMKRQGEGDACTRAGAFNWKEGHQQSGSLEAVWYAIDITDAKAQMKDITVTLTNQTAHTATVHADVAFECPYVDLESMTRKVEANATLTKTIPYSTFGAMGTDVIYVGVTTDYTIKIKADTTDVILNPVDDACLSAEVFDWTYGQALKAGESKWYKVGLNEIRTNTTLIPVLTIKNQGTGKATINGEMSIDCPDSIPNVTRTLTIAKGDSYERELARDLFKNISDDVDTVYIKVTSNQDITFEITMLKEDEGASCTSAKLFNWVSGEELIANLPMWYKIDLSGIGEKDVKITLTNLESTEVKGLGWLAPTCPCETPQEQSFTLAAKAEKSRVIPNSTFEPMGSEVYIRVMADGGIKIKAELVDPDPFTPITACTTATEITNFNTPFTLTADTTWYFIVKETLQTILDEAELYSPELTITNGTSNDVKLKAEIAFHCPVTKAMQSKTTTVKAGKTLTKVLERSMAEQYAGQDTIYVCFTGENATGIQFELNMVDANTGNDCQHATIIVPGDTISHNWYNMEANTTKWYRLYTSELIKNPYMIRATIKSNGVPYGTDAVVKAELYNSCEGELLESATRKVYSATSISKEASSDLLAGLSDSVLYLLISTNEPISLTLDTFSRKKLDEQDTICLQAKAVLPNIRYYQAATDTVWYVVDTKNLRNNTEYDGLLEVTNMAGKQMKMKAELTYDCPVIYEMTEKTITINAGETFTKVAERATINNVKQDYAYLRVSVTNALEFTSADSLNFILKIEQSTGDDCMNPILFDWDNGNIHPADSTYWYKVVLVDEDNKLVIPENKDLRLYILNREQKEGTADASFYFDCYKDPKQNDGHTAYNFTAEQLKYKDIDRDLIDTLGVTSLTLMLYSTVDLYIYAKFIDQMADSVVTTYINDYACDGGNYEDSIAKNILHQEATEYLHTIDASDPTTWTWEDHYRVQDGVILVDSVYVFEIKPIVQAEINDEDIEVLPIVAQGMNVDTVGVTEWFITQLAAHDTISSLNESTISWEINKGTGYEKLTDSNCYIDRDVNSVLLKISFADSCDNAFEYTFDTLSLWRTDSLVSIDVISTCESQYTWRGKVWDLTAGEDNYLRDTVKTFVFIDTLGQSLKRDIDSVYVQKITPSDKPTLPGMDILSVNRKLTQHLLPLTDVEAAILTDIANQHTADPAIADVDDAKVTWKIKVGTTFTALNTSNDSIPFTAESVTLKYTVSVCNDLMDKEITFTPDTITLHTTLTETVCEADLPYNWQGQDLIASGDYTNTVKSEVNNRCDSVITLILTVNETVTPVQQDTLLCAGATLEWRNNTYTEAGVYKDTVRYEATGCDSLIYTITLSYLPEAYEVNEDTTLNAGEVLDWHSLTITEAGEYKDTLLNQLLCDSVYFTINVTYNPLIDTVYKTITDTVCPGATYLSRRKQEVVILADTTWKETKRFESINTDSIYTYNILVYHTDLPAYDWSDVHAICGQAMDLEEAEKAILAMTEADDLYAPNPQVVWEIQAKGETAWSTPDEKYIISSKVDEYTLRYYVSNECLNTEPLATTLTVEKATADNTKEYNQIEAKSFYGDRLLMINLDSVRALLDTVPAENDVVWYMVVGEIDPIDAVNGDDKEVGRGYYYTLPEAATITGQYYARLKVDEDLTTDECETILRTKVIDSTNPVTNAPAIRPTMASPGQTLEIYNLNPTQVAEIRVYNTEGVLLETYRAQEAETFMMKAANMSGYYMVQVAGEQNMVTLKYIVK